MEANSFSREPLTPQREKLSLSNSPGRQAGDRKNKRTISPIDPWPSGLGYQHASTVYRFSNRCCLSSSSNAAISGSS
jgi:hypothetical protein